MVDNWAVAHSITDYRRGRACNVTTKQLCNWLDSETTTLSKSTCSLDVFYFYRKSLTIDVFALTMRVHVIGHNITLIPTRLMVVIQYCNANDSMFGV